MFEFDENCKYNLVQLVKPFIKCMNHSINLNLGANKYYFYNSILSLTSHLTHYKDSFVDSSFLNAVAKICVSESFEINSDFAISAHLFNIIKLLFVNHISKKIQFEDSVLCSLVDFLFHSLEEILNNGVVGSDTEMILSEILVILLFYFILDAFKLIILFLKFFIMQIQQKSHYLP